MDEDTMSRATIYPDPEDTPRYPWLGDRGINIPSFEQQTMPRDAARALVDEETHSQLGLSGPSLWNQSISDSDGEIDDSATVMHYGCDSHVLVIPDINNLSEDPDFEISDDDHQSDESMSGEDSDDLDDEQLFSLSDRKGTKSTRGRGRGRGRGARGRVNEGRGRGNKGFRRGLRKPLEPGLDFKVLHSQATMAFIDQEYDKAAELVQQAIYVNPEMFSAHSLLSEIHQARGEQNKAIIALFNGAHTRPRDTQLWSKVANLVLEQVGSERHKNLRTAVYCYSRVINVEQENNEARLQRASLNQELGYKGKAGREYERILTHLPYNTEILRHLAEIYSEPDDVERVLRYYDNCIAHYRITEPQEVISFTWSDVNIYAELHGFLEDFEDGISKIKSLSRWLLGRSDDTIWDGFDINDCEWDAEDQPRRAEVVGFVPSQYSSATYGGGLPLELRIKLGVYRLKMPEGDLEEALNHFDWLVPENEGPDSKLYDYPDLFREAGDSLRCKSFYSEALRFYEPLQRVDNYADALYYFDMAVCYRSLGMRDEAEDCYHTVIKNDRMNFGARVHLAKFFEEVGMTERASFYANEAVVLERTETVNTRREYLTERELALGSSSTAMVLGSGPIPRNQRRVTDKLISEQAKDDSMRLLFSHLQTLKASFSTGDEEAKQEWISTANELIADFRSHKAFYPGDQHIKFLGVSGDQARQNEVRTEDLANVPCDYRGISLDAWLDLFLVYAFTVAQDGDKGRAYEAMSAASESVVFLKSAESMFSIQVCWFTCALMVNDEETLVNVARWFMKEYQFITDAYRLFSALNRLCDNSNVRYNFGPSQKFILRQIKAMDFYLGPEAVQKSAASERANLTFKDKNGNLVPPEAMDVALIMLYGHVLYAGTSYSYAIAYFLRAYALDPTNPMINLSLALAYIHYALKRQSSNRHQLITQGFTFLFEYYDIRRSSSYPSERQEAAYNVGRAYHLLGLTHLAIPYYEDCLALSPDAQAASSTTAEDFAREAAFALQELWALGGEVELANTVTKEWLVI